jgi:alkylation response protein AidB-like acyl-CoA dehydrogenase
LSPETRGNGDTRWNRPFASCLVSRTTRHDDGPDETETVIHTIFEGTSEIQQLVISRAISGLRIE